MDGSPLPLRLLSPNLGPNQILEVGIEELATTSGGAGYRYLIRDAGGAVVARGGGALPPVSAEGTVRVFDQQGAPRLGVPGEYELELSVRDGTLLRAGRLPFTVEPGGGIPPPIEEAGEVIEPELPSSRRVSK